MMETNEELTITQPPKNRSLPKRFIFDLLLVLILIIGTTLRLAGSYWGEYTYMHPDERFLLWVGADISPVNLIPNPNATTAEDQYKKVWLSFSEYFDTANSPLNPHNRGHGFYVYGTLPMFITRAAVELIEGQTGFQEMLDVGRPLSALADVLTVVLVYLVAARLYDRRVGLLAAAFSALAVLQIQQSHFFTMDTFINMFTFLAFYFAVRVSMGNGAEDLDDPNTGIEAESEIPASTVRVENAIRNFFRHPYFWLSLAFGIALGMAVASKLNAVLMALALPAAMGLRLISLRPKKREEALLPMFFYLCLAALASLITFRIGQPYAFSGPGFLGIQPNPLWIENIKSLLAQTSGDVDFPPALQWARRSVLFSGQNLVVWGLGLPLGILAWAGFIAAGWRILKGEWQRHALIWGWTAAYFAWQSLAFNPTMRYQLPIYPTLEIFAAWLVFYLYDQGKKKAASDLPPQPRKIPWLKILAVLLGSVVLLGTFAWAAAFTGIYTRPFTRVAGSRWIYQNVPGPINLHIQTEEGLKNQPIPVTSQYTLRTSMPLMTSFIANQSGNLYEIYLGHMLDRNTTSNANELRLSVSSLPNEGMPLGGGTLRVFPSSSAQTEGLGYILPLDSAIPITKDSMYYLSLSDPLGNLAWDLCGEFSAFVQTSSGLEEISLTPPETCSFAAGGEVSLTFQSSIDGSLVELYLTNAQSQAPTPGSKTIQIILSSTEQAQPLATVSITSDFTEGQENYGKGYLVTLDQPVQIVKDRAYSLSIALTSGEGALSLRGSAIANEGEWDDSLPLRIDGYDPFGGLYTTDLNFNMYWDDNPDKLERFSRILNEAEYIVITSNRQYGTLPRLPERFPMSTIYYRNLLGCPQEKTIEWCYRVAKPGQFAGGLGFELVETIQSDPQIGPISINTQFAEEAFTVYDHPKVLIFKKTDQYDPQKVREILGAVDFTKIIHLTPKKAGSYPGDLMLPADRLRKQQQGGTWAELFDTKALQNRYPVLGVIFWYLALTLLGWAVYPVLRLALPGLSDRGYPLARTAGMLGLSFFAWIAGSFGIPFTRLTIGLIYTVLLLGGLCLAYRQREALRQELRSGKKYFLLVEGLALVFFLAFLLVRLGNSDLWHPYFGGEKPMDFSYFNAILKSTSFPPYDPWYAGGYLNYYYYGFVFVGTLVKLLGVVPSFAYNLILPCMFSLIALGAFSGAWNLVSHPKQSEANQPSMDSEKTLDETHPPSIEFGRLSSLTVWAGVSAAVLMLVLGNLGTLRMIFRGYANLGLTGAPYEEAGLIERWSAASKGLGQVLAGASLPYGVGDWYWIPSRLMPPGDNAITEFPAFTFLYADLHAHLFALPIALLCLGWALSAAFSRAKWGGFGSGVLGFFLGALAIGSLRPTNTWDFPTYLALGCLALTYGIWQNDPDEVFLRSRLLSLLAGLPKVSKRLFQVVLALAVLVGLSVLLYQPYMHWYGQAYSSIDPWNGPVTPFSAYFTHWGLFLFIIVTWMIWETREWLASTPVSSLKKLVPYREIIGLAMVLLLVLIILLVIKFPTQAEAPQSGSLPFGKGAVIALVALPLAAWAGVLLLRPKLPAAKQVVLFLIGTCLVITLFVEVYVLRGDIGRQNTVFKLYLQAWTIYAVCAGACLAWLYGSFRKWSSGWYYSWQAAFAFLAFAAMLFPLLATTAKIKDRMVPEAPHTLDGMDYMKYANYAWIDRNMDLSQDYNAIRWMQENIQGSPVIVEANSRNLYRWYNRFTIYTGLPNVAGWEWHQQQQRAVNPGTWVSQRINEIDEFYYTTDLELAADFLKKYNVQYIVVGQLELASYPGAGLEKFTTASGTLWDPVYQEKETTLYKVR
jgi:YYY domain-containing protein